MNQEQRRELFEALRELAGVYDCDFDEKTQTLTIIYDEQGYDNREYFEECIARIPHDFDEWVQISEVCEDHGIDCIEPVKAFPKLDCVTFVINGGEPPKSFMVEAEDKTTIGLKEVFYDASTKLWYLEGHQGEGMTTIGELFEATTYKE